MSRPKSQRTAGLAVHPCGAPDVGFPYRKPTGAPHKLEMGGMCGVVAQLRKSQEVSRARFSGQPEQPAHRGSRNASLAPMRPWCSVMSILRTQLAVAGIRLRVRVAERPWDVRAHSEHCDLTSGCHLC